MKKLFGILQKVGKSLMLPVALLPAAGILLGLGNALGNETVLAQLPFLGASWVQLLATMMESSGQIIFDNLPLIFAVGVAVGLTEGEGVAALAAIVGFLVMNTSMGVIGGITVEMTNQPMYASVLGIPTLQTGVFGGIIIGIIASSLYKKYYKIELPQYLGFFAGKRFVPIITAASALVLGIGLTFIWPEGEGVAALAAIVGFLVMNTSMGVIGGITVEMTNQPMYASVLGIPTLQTGVFGGIIIGIIASSLYKKYYKIELPQYLGFFAGKRFVPIITAASALVLGIGLTFIWPPIQNALFAFSTNVIEANQTLAAFLFGVVERALIPFGLHHVFYNPFWYQFGEYVNNAGQLVMGDQSIWFAQLKDGVAFTAGTFMTGKYPFMMFGLPAAALAMVHTAKPEKRKYVAGIMLSGYQVH